MVIGVERALEGGGGGGGGALGDYFNFMIIDGDN